MCGDIYFRSMLCEGDKSNKICQHTNSKDIAEQAGIVHTPLVLSLLFKKPDTELDFDRHAG